MTTPFLDVLDKPRQEVFTRLKAFAGKTTLGGGTALALQIGHRRSFDFDLFMPKPISRSLYREVQTVFNEEPKKLIDTGDQLTIVLTNRVEITFLYYWHLPLYPTIATPSVRIFDKHDIATDKALNIGRRNMWRDYVDFFFLLHDGHLTLETIGNDALQRFGNEFSAKLFAEQLAYTKDLADYSATFLGKRYSVEEITEYLEKQSVSYINSLL